MTVKLKLLEAPPDWWGTAKITVPGQPEPVEIEVKWRYKDKPAFNTWFAAITEGGDTDEAALMLEVIADWKGPDMPCSHEAVTKLLNWSVPSGAELFRAYRRALSESRVKN